jgi:hypothetical protein
MLAPDTIIDRRYRILRPIGKGGMGAAPAATRARHRAPPTRAAHQATPANPTEPINREQQRHHRHVQDQVQVETAQRQHIAAGALTTISTIPHTASSTPGNF